MGLQEENAYLLGNFYPLALERGWNEHKETAPYPNPPLRSLPLQITVGEN